MKELERCCLAVVLLLALALSSIIALSVPPAIPRVPPSEPIHLELEEIPVYYGDPIPDELIDAVIGEEWNDAGVMSVWINSWRAWVYFKHDGDYLYLCLKILTGREFRHYTEAYILFDNGDDEAFGPDDDILSVEGEKGVPYEADFYYVGRFAFEFDPAFGGSNDAWGIGAYNQSDSSYVFEFVRVLNSGDPLDVPLTYDNTVRIILGFVGVSSPPDEAMSSWFGIRIQTRTTTDRDLQRARQQFAELKRNLVNSDLISDVPDPREVRLNSVSHYDPEGYILYISAGSPLDVVAHEYGHFLFHTLVGDAHYRSVFRPVHTGADHTVLSQFPGTRANSLSGAFEEAFATFIAAVAKGSLYWSDGTQGVDLETNTVSYGEKRTHPTKGTTEEATVTVMSLILDGNVRFMYDVSYSDGVFESIDGPDLDGQRVEGCIASALWDIFDGEANGMPDEDKDGLSVKLQDILDVIRNSKPKNFADFVKALRDELPGDQQMALDRILKAHGVG